MRGKASGILFNQKYLVQKIFVIHQLERESYMSSPVNKCHMDDKASYNPEYLERQVCATETSNAELAAEDIKLVSAPDSSGSKLPYILGLLGSPRFHSPSAFKNIESLLTAGKKVARPAVSAAETIGKSSAAFWDSVGGLFGAALGGLLAGPGPALAYDATPQGLDFSSDRLQGLGLKPEEILVLTSEFLEHPERSVMLHEALARPTIKEQREELRAMIRIILQPGEMVQIEDDKGNVLGRYTHESSNDKSPPPAEVVQREGAKNGPCLPDMVFVPSGTYKNKAFPAICVDKSEYSNTPDRMPLVNESHETVTQLCSKQGKRLPSADEWARVASANGTLEFSTRTGEFDFRNPVGLKAIHYNERNPRPVCMAAGAYITYGGKEICDLNGNVHEWTSDHFIVGGAFTAINERQVRADYRRNTTDYGNLLVGFRCVSPPRIAK